MILFQEQGTSHSLFTHAAYALAEKSGLSCDGYLRVFLNKMRGCLEFDSISDKSVSETKRLYLNKFTLEDVENLEVIASAFLATQKQIIDRDERSMNRNGFAVFESDSARKHCYLATKDWVASVERCLAYANMCANGHFHISREYGGHDLWGQAKYDSILKEMDVPHEFCSNICGLVSDGEFIYFSIDGYTADKRFCINIKDADKELLFKLSHLIFVKYCGDIETGSDRVAELYRSIMGMLKD